MLYFASYCFTHASAALSSVVCGVAMVTYQPSAAGKPAADSISAEYMPSPPPLIAFGMMS